MATKKISKKKHLLIDHNLELVLQAHFEDKSLKLVSVDRGGNNNIMEGVNNQFASDLDKWRITVSRNGKTETLRAILKVPIQSSFQRILMRINKLFMREVFWYTEALPALGPQFPILQSLAPTCYYGFTSFDDDYR